MDYTPREEEDWESEDFWKDVFVDSTTVNMLFINRTLKRHWIVCTAELTSLFDLYSLPKNILKYSTF